MIRLEFGTWIGKAWIPMQIDVGFGNITIPEARDDVSHIAGHGSAGHQSVLNGDHRAANHTSS